MSNVAKLKEAVDFFQQLLYFNVIFLLESFLDFFDVVEFFPSEEFYFRFEGWPIV